MLVIICFAMLLSSVLSGDRFPNESKKYVISIKGKEQTFYPYKAYDYLFVSLGDIAHLGESRIKFFKRNPHICFKVKVTMVFTDFVTVSNSTRKVFFRERLQEDLKNISKGDNIWIFAKLKIYENNEYDLITQYFFDLPSDEEVFLAWRQAVPSENPDALIELGFRAVKTGKEKGNLKVWKKLGLQAIEEGIKIKQQKLTNPDEYITIAGKVLQLLDDKEFALKVVLMGWEKNKENSNLEQYLKHVLGYTYYKGTWMPESRGYEKEFQDRFNSIKFTEDDKMWQLKRWVETNAEKFGDPQEKIILCARRTYEMNPSRKDAAAFLGREPVSKQDFTATDTVTVSRKPVVFKTESGTLEFTIENFWIRETAVVEPVKAQYKTGEKGMTSLTVTAVEWGSNLEEVNRKYIDRVKDLPEYKLIENDPVTIRGKSYYLAEYSYIENGTTIKAQAVIIKTKGDLPGLAVVFRAPQDSFNTYSKEFAVVRGSLLYKE